MTDRHAAPVRSELFAGRLLVLVAAVAWSSGGVFAKAPVFDDWPIASGGFPVRGVMLAFWRAVFASMVLLPFVRRPRWTPRLVPAGLTFLAMNVTYLTAMTMTTAANAIWLQNTAPIWVFLVGVFWLGERLHPGDRLLLTLGMVGVATILFFELRGQVAVGVLWGLASGIFYAGVVLSIRQLRDQDPAWVVAVIHAATAAILAPYVVAQGIWPSADQFVYLICFGVLQMGLPYLLFARGLRLIAGHEAAGIALLEPLLMPIWVYLAWGNVPAWWTILGGGLILSGLLLRYAGKDVTAC